MKKCWPWIYWPNKTKQSSEKNRNIKHLTIAISHMLTGLTRLSETQLRVICFCPSRFVSFKKFDFCFIWQIMGMNKWNSRRPPDFNTCCSTGAIQWLSMTFTVLQVTEPQLDTPLICNILNSLLQYSLGFQPQPFGRRKRFALWAVLPAPCWLHRSCTSISSIQGPAVKSSSLRSTHKQKH